jgi:hypothetical protein
MYLDKHANADAPSPAPLLVPRGGRLREQAVVVVISIGVSPLGNTSSVAQQQCSSWPRAAGGGRPKRSRAPARLARGLAAEGRCGVAWERGPDAPSRSLALTSSAPCWLRVVVARWRLCGQPRRIGTAAGSRRPSRARERRRCAARPAPPTRATRGPWRLPPPCESKKGARRYVSKVRD